MLFSMVTQGVCWVTISRVSCASAGLSTMAAAQTSGTRGLWSRATQPTQRDGNRKRAVVCTQCSNGAVYRMGDSTFFSWPEDQGAAARAVNSRSGRASRPADLSPNPRSPGTDRTDVPAVARGAQPTRARRLWFLWCTVATKFPQDCATNALRSGPRPVRTRWRHPSSVRTCEVQTGGLSVTQKWCRDGGGRPGWSQGGGRPTEKWQVADCGRVALWSSALIRAAEAEEGISRSGLPAMFQHW